MVEFVAILNVVILLYTIFVLYLIAVDHQMCYPVPQLLKANFISDQK